MKEMNVIAAILSIIYYLIIIFIIIRILLENRKPIYSAALIGLMIVLPVVGLIIFFFVAYKMNKSSFVSKKWHSERKDIQAWKESTYTNIEKHQKRGKTPFKEWNKIINMLFLYEKSTPTYYNDVEVLINGEEFFPRLIEDLSNAIKQIHIEFYVFENDKIGNEILKVLFRKAEEGVKIRFIIDSFGSRSMNKKMFKLLRDNNIEVFSFLPLFTPKLFRFMNIRDHRKLVTIDGNIAYTGGINVADRYINNKNYPTKKEKRFWRDTQIRVCGEAVKSFQLQFFNIWKFVSKQQNDFFEEIVYSTYKTENECITQLMDSGPDSEFKSILNTLFLAFTNAEKEILIQTPYFCPPDELYTAIQNAALSGVTVKIIIPEISDNKIVTDAARSYVEGLLSANVQFFMYTKGFIHSKIMIVDDSLSTVGSTNLDYRSFSSNYEMNAVFYNKEINQQLKSVFNNDLKECTQIDLNTWKHRPFFKVLEESVARLFAPLI
ncbi:MAG: cardiolipin synthase [Bacteroidales bacterium]|nr:cardiolipin synthase [Bacteroidales bacterium]